MREIAVPISGHSSEAAEACYLPSGCVLDRCSLWIVHVHESLGLPHNARQPTTQRSTMVTVRVILSLYVLCTVVLTPELYKIYPIVSF